MIASPGDVRGERNLVREVLQEWNAVNAEHRGTVLLPLGWEMNVAPEMGDQPQSIINKQILGDADVMVGIFWTRLGTPTQNYGSGSVEELEQHMAAGKPTMIYFSGAPVMPDSIDMAQYSALKAFRASCQSRGVYEVYSDLTDFRQKFSRQLQIVLSGGEFAGADVSPLPIKAKTTATEAGAALSHEAKQLIKAGGAPEAGGTIMRLAHGMGTSIFVAEQRFTEDTNPRSVALWESAIEELEAAGLVKCAGDAREVFELTRRGFDVADSVAL